MHCRSCRTRHILWSLVNVVMEWNVQQTAVLYLVITTSWTVFDEFSPSLHHYNYNSACMTDRLEMFAHTSGFSRIADSVEPCNMLWADPCCHGNKIWARRGDRVAYQLVVSYVCISVCVCFCVNTAVVACILIEELRYILLVWFSSSCCSDGHAKITSGWWKQRYHCVVSTAFVCSCICRFLIFLCR